MNPPNVLSSKMDTARGECGQPDSSAQAVTEDMSTPVSLFKFHDSYVALREFQTDSDPQTVSSVILFLVLIPDRALHLSSTETDTEPCNI